MNEDDDILWKGVISGATDLRCEVMKSHRIYLYVRSNDNDHSGIEFSPSRAVLSSPILESFHVRHFSRLFQASSFRLLPNKRIIISTA